MEEEKELLTVRVALCFEWQVRVMSVFIIHVLPHSAYSCAHAIIQRHKIINRNFPQKFIQKIQFALLYIHPRLVHAGLSRL